MDFLAVSEGQPPESRSKVDAVERVDERVDRRIQPTCSKNK